MEEKKQTTRGLWRNQTPEEIIGGVLRGNSDCWPGNPIPGQTAEFFNKPKKEAWEEYLKD